MCRRLLGIRGSGPGSLTRPRGETGRDSRDALAIRGRPTVRSKALRRGRISLATYRSGRASLPLGGRSALQSSPVPALRFSRRHASADASSSLALDEFPKYRQQLSSSLVEIVLGPDLLGSTPSHRHPQLWRLK